MRKCSIEGCCKPYRSLGFCENHYRRFRLYGDATIMKRCSPSATIEEKFNFYIDKTDGCWEWTGTKNKRGYGYLSVNGKALTAHRMSYEIHIKPIPIGLYVLHKCDNTSCANPDHLFIGTHKNNMDDMVSKNRQSQGEMVTTSKLKNRDIQVIRGLIKNGNSLAGIGKLFNVHANTIRAIKDGRTWRCVK